ncbi:UMODL1 isoform 9, partial [Pan troglodytes]
PVGSWYNVTILVKMDFKELQQVDPRLLNHMRLLHSLLVKGTAQLASKKLALKPHCLALVLPLISCVTLGHQCPATNGLHRPPPALSPWGRLHHSVAAATGPAAATACGQ